MSAAREQANFERGMPGAQGRVQTRAFPGAELFQEQSFSRSRAFPVAELFQEQSIPLTHLHVEHEGCEIAARRRDGRLADGLRQIRDRGMTPVLGNGVASDPGCWMEACVMRGLVDNAGEMNGFLKPLDGLFTLPLAVEGGRMMLESGLPALKPADDLSALSIDAAIHTGGA